ncbi:sortase, marine proteobacterial type [Gammaproteobacteria bacterium 45_16_T64]|nr:sortase, marine proteobacterial type [Gammaproteobacteria bacterium 45_16_T64]
MKGWLNVVMIVLILLGVSQLGHGGYLIIKAQLAQIMLEQAWAEAQDINRDVAFDPVKPWPWADTSPLAKLRFDELNQSLIVLTGASGRNLAFGPAHVSGSAVLGEAGVSVIGGHRDTHFALLQHIGIQDQLSIELPSGEIIGYKVTNISVVDSRQSQIALDADRSTLALVACYPFDAVEAGGPLRFVVMAEAIKKSPNRLVL